MVDVDVEPKEGNETKKRFEKCCRCRCARILRSFRFAKNHENTESESETKFQRLPCILGILFGFIDRCSRLCDVFAIVDDDEESSTAFDGLAAIERKSMSRGKVTSARGRREMVINVVHSHRQTVQKIRTLTRRDGGKRLSAVSLLESPFPFNVITTSPRARKWRGTRLFCDVSLHPEFRPCSRPHVEPEVIAAHEFQ